MLCITKILELVIALICFPIRENMLYLLSCPSNKIYFWNIKHFFTKEVEGETFYCDSIICTNTKRQKYTGNIVFLLTGIHRDLVCYCFLKFICGSGPADYWKTYLQLHPLSSLSEKCSIRKEKGSLISPSKISLSLRCFTKRKEKLFTNFYLKCSPSI